LSRFGKYTDRTQWIAQVPPLTIASTRSRHRAPLGLPWGSPAAARWAARPDCRRAADGYRSLSL